MSSQSARGPPPPSPTSIASKQANQTAGPTKTEGTKQNRKLEIYSFEEQIHIETILEHG
jgi:hypothetical protein